MMRVVPAVVAAAVILLSGSVAMAESRTYDMPSFEAVDVSTGISAIVEVGGPQKIEAEAANAATLDRLKVEVRGVTLHLSIDGNIVSWLFSLGQQRPMVVRVSAPSIKAADASSGADLDIKGMKGGGLSMSASSGAAISAQQVSGERVSLDTSSGGTLKASGTCTNLVASASSGGNLEARDLSCADVTVDVSSGGHAEINAREAIRANASSGGSVTVHGGPQKVDVNSSIGGSVNFAS